MARRTVVAYVDDLDGKELKDAVTITFSVDNKTYEFDTSPAHAKQFREDLDKYVTASRSAGTRRSRTARGSRSSSRDLKAVREWARESGYEVSDRGRIASEIIEAYDAAK
ncbi:histone-like nucleoid-structuring protein Lsr2 [Gordonia sp. DT30]|uniref:histone-like nucleoid-structuring protein Lsr2 n=1 Tax=unclassified Gordonia (in: high G+C Gram-positive bacteria) TaxID=2657482 RepID=UPI003CE6ECD3